MSEINCKCKCNCIGISIIASIIIGIIAAIFSHLGVILIPTAFAWALFIISIVLLTVLIMTSAKFCPRSKQCACNSLSALLTGILGTILISVFFLINVYFSTKTVIPGLLLFFFSLTVSSSVCLIKCNYDCD